MQARALQQTLQDLEKGQKAQTAAAPSDEQRGEIAAKNLQQMEAQRMEIDQQRYPIGMKANTTRSLK
jgi:hypothetical protein